MAKSKLKRKWRSLQRRRLARRIGGTPPAKLAELTRDQIPEKARSLPERFREIISDPVNLLIERHPMAGAVVAGDFVVTLAGLQVPLWGRHRTVMTLVRY